MALIVRNTFLDISEQDDNLQQARSSSAPPTCRHKGDFDIEVKISAKCETVESERSTEHSTSASDIESVEEEFSSSRSSSCDHDESDHEYEDLSPSLSRDESDTEDEVACCAQQEPVNEQQQLTEAAAQEQLDKMSQMVMDIWSKLQSVESSIEARCEEVAPAPEVEAAPSVAPAASATGQSVAASKLDGKARSFVPGSCSGSTDVQCVFSRMKEAVMKVQGVAAVEVNLGPKGTLATVAIQLQSFAQGMLLKDVVAAAKSALLEAASNSETTYVLGYEAAPFEDDRDGCSFVAALADCPKAWECSACWDTYTTGSCRRRRTCKCHHPGRNELQPVRVVVC